MNKIHYCKQLKSYQHGDDSPSVSIKYDNDASGWMFTYTRFADEKEVEMGEAEYVGELVSKFEILIYFCPYCGEELIEN